ncbi:MAG: hypothetical protein WCD44_03200 [Candidatus Babeliales bacterium]
MNKVEKEEFNLFVAHKLEEVCTLLKKSDRSYIKASVEQLKKAVIITKEYQQERLILIERNIREHELQTLIAQLEQMKV